MARNLQVAILGCGRVAGHHCFAISRTPGIELNSLCDLDIERARKYGQEYDVPWYINYHEMFEKNPDIDLVSVVTPSGMHGEHAAEILENYDKSVIVEKPTFLNVPVAEKTFSIAKKKALHIFPVFQNRYNKAVKRAKKAIVSDEIGAIRIISVRVRWCRPQRYYDLSPWRGTFSQDGGAIANQGIHHVDLLTYLGGKVSRVNSLMKTMGADIEVEDTVVASLEYEHGGLGAVECTTAARPDDYEASISIVGSKGLVQIGGVAVNELQVFTPNPSECLENSEEFKGLDGMGAVYGYGHLEVYNDVVSHFRTKKKYPISETDCMNTLNVLDAFYRSNEIGNWVSPDDKNYSQYLGEENKELSDLYRTPKPKKSSY